jgi:hypothetical protein
VSAQEGGVLNVRSLLYQKSEKKEKKSAVKMAARAKSDAQWWIYLTDLFILIYNAVDPICGSVGTYFNQWKSKARKWQCRYCPKNIESFDNCKHWQERTNNVNCRTVDKSHKNFLIFQLRQDPDSDRHPNGQSNPHPDRHQNDADPQQ